MTDNHLTAALALFQPSPFDSKPSLSRKEVKSLWRAPEISAVTSSILPRGFPGSTLPCGEAPPVRAFGIARSPKIVLPIQFFYLAGL
jgi:hypothetical protein